MKKARIILPQVCVLGEGCVWDDKTKQLYFTDIEGGAVYCWKEGNKVTESYRMNGRTGCVVLHSQGGIVAAVTDRLEYLEPETGKSSCLLHQNFPSFLRYNDGKCAPDGSLWIGTMAIDQAHPGAKGGGYLYQIKDNKVIREFPGYTIPNGMAWSHDSKIFYHIDTPLQSVFAYDTGEMFGISGRRTVISIQPEDGSPDGMCMDADGNLWIALWGGSKVACYEPESGKLLEEVQVPAKYVSCCTFGGENMDMLYITTAMDEEGNGGQLFGVEMDRKGLAPYRYGGKIK